jgi:hypothetical protein
MDAALVATDVSRSRDAQPARLVSSGSIRHASRGAPLTLAQWRVLDDADRRRWVRANIQTSVVSAHVLLTQIETQIARDAAACEPKIKPWVAAGISESTWYRRRRI